MSNTNKEKKPYRIAIVGTSKAEEYDIVIRFVVYGKLKTLKKEGKEVIFVSGGCVGVDTIAERIATMMGLKKEIYLPKEQKYRYFKQRDLEIGENCDEIVCITTRKQTKECMHHGKNTTRSRTHRRVLYIKECKV